MVPLNYIHRKCTGGNKFTKSQENINPYFIYINIKLFETNEKVVESLLETIRTYSQDKGMEFGIKICHAHN